MKQSENKKVVAEIKKALANPIALLELMENKKVNRNNIPTEFMEDALKALKKSVRLLSKLNKS